MLWGNKRWWSPSICTYKDTKKHLSGGFGAKVGSILNLLENDIIKIVYACGQKGQDYDDYSVGAGGGGGT